MIWQTAGNLQRDLEESFVIISGEKLELLNAISDFDRRIEKMHLDFQKFHSGVEKRMPDWERLERNLVAFSRRRIYETEISHRLDRVLFKFQNRKKIWLSWAEEVHKGSAKGKS